MRAFVLTSVLGIALTGLVLSAHNPSGTPPVSLGPLIPVSPPGSGVHHLLFRASGDPSSGVLMTCGSRLSSRRNAWEGFVYASYDAGRTWQETLTESSSKWSSEHSCALGMDNRAYFVAGVSNTDTGLPRHEFGRMYLYASADQGRTWGSPSVSPFLDWTAVAVDRTQGSNHGRIYVWGNVLSDGRGEWIEGRPVLLTSDDDGRTLKEPAFPASPRTYLRGGAYSLETVVLNNGTVVVAFEGVRAEGQGFASRKNRTSNPNVFPEVLRSIDGGRTVGESIILGDPRVSIAISLAVDRTRNLLYAAWIQEDQGRRRVLVARSTDQASTWQPGVVVTGEAENVSAGYPSVAIGRDEMVGLVWPSGGGACFRFAVSSDQGRSFGQPVDLNSCDATAGSEGQVRSNYLYSVPFAEQSPGKGSIENLGLSVRVDSSGPPARTGKAVLLVDAEGKFHPVWVDSREGLTQVWTRTVTVGDSAGTFLDVANLTDLSKLIHLQLSNNRFNPTSSVFYVDLALLNPGPDAICGPVRIVASGLRSDYGSVEINNADNLGRGDGAIWDMTDSLKGGVLRPWSASMPRTLGFKVKNFAPPANQGNPVSVGLKVFGNTSVSCGSPR